MVKIGQPIEDFEFEYFQDLDIKKQKFSHFQVNGLFCFSPVYS